MTRDAHPLRDALITPAPTVYPVDDVTDRLYRRDGVRRGERAFPTMGTTRGDPRWRWGRPADRPSSSGAPLLMSPSDLEKDRTPESTSRPSIADVVRRLRP